MKSRKSKSSATPRAPKNPKQSRLLRALGPGLITGAADDDPSGIATYSQAGAQFGFAITWTLLLTYPLMTASPRTFQQTRSSAYSRRNFRGQRGEAPR